ncbi:MAG: hypothetical protein P8Y44_13165 [Acidobacteriota bacterium]
MGSSLEEAESRAGTVSTEELMTSIRGGLRRRHLADIAVNPLESARSQLEAALDSRPSYRPLLAELIDEQDWKIKPAIRFRSHRPVVGRMLIFVKRRLVLPVVYWLYQYCSENFRAQKRVNEGLMILTETLAQENARLRLDIDRLTGILAAGSDDSGGRPEMTPRDRG